MKVRSILTMLLLTIVVFQMVPGQTSVEEAAKEPVKTVAEPPFTGPTRAPGLYGGLITYEDVLVVINKQSLISKDIGEYFVQQRGVPAQNVVYVNVSPAETVARSEFNKLRSQLQNNITSRDLTDKINYIVTTKGVPLRVTGPNQAVDSELSLILGPYASSIGLSSVVNSPYFDKDEPINHSKHGIYIVTRLTGYTVEEAKNLVNLSAASYRSDGLFAFDAGGPYAEGDNWLIAANTTMYDKGYNTSLDTSSVFQMNYQDVIGYCSWGSNGQGYGSNFVSNNGFETDSSPADGVPDGWTTFSDGSSAVTRSSDTAYSGTYSAKIERPSVTAGTSYIGRNITITPGARYYATGYVNLSGVAGGKGAHLFIKAFDSNDNLLAQYNGSSLTGTRLWRSMGQAHYEPPAGVAYVMVGAALSEASGIAYFDTLTLRVIKPNNTWLPGAIAETFVSTGGRSMTYGTSYGQSLIADTIREGVSGISGHVYEPFLTACGRPYIMFDSYTNGYSMGESFYQALPWLSWMEVVVGDPKMCPYFDNRIDLSLESAQLDKTVIPQEQQLQFSSKVVKTGYLWDQTINVSVFIENGTSGPLQQYDVTLVMKNKDHFWVNVSFDTTGLVGGYNLTIILDELKEVRERDESNNIAVLPFTVVTAPHAKKIVFTPEAVLRSGSTEVVIQPGDLVSTVDLLNVSCSAKHAEMDWIDINLTYAASDAGTGLNEVFKGTFQTELYFPLGYYTFVFNITNPYGLQTDIVESSAVEVLNNDPWIAGVDIDPDAVERNGSARIKVYPNDLETTFNHLSVKLWQSRDNSSWTLVSGVERDNDGFYYGDVSFYKSSNLGDVFIKAVATDQDGNASEPYYAAGWLQVTNSLPVLGSMGADPHSVLRGEQVDITLKAEDFETSPQELNISLEYKNGGDWTLMASPVYDEEANEYSAALFVNKEFKTVPISFKAVASDPEGGVSSWKWLNNTVLVGNNLPKVDSAMADRTSVYRGQKVNFTLKCSDYEDDGVRLHPQLQYKIGDTGGWSDPADLAWVSGDEYSAEVPVPKDEPAGEMVIRAQVFDSDTFGLNNVYWTDFPEVKVNVLNNPPVIQELQVPPALNGTAWVEVDFLVKAADLEDKDLTVTVHWTLGSLEGDVVLTRTAHETYKGSLKQDIPPAGGPFHFDYRVEAVDADGGKDVKNYEGATEVSRDTGGGGSGGDDDTSDDRSWLMWALIPIIIIAVLILAAVAFIVINRGSWPHRERPPSLPPEGKVPPHEPTAPPVVHTGQAKSMPPAAQTVKETAAREKPAKKEPIGSKPPVAEEQEQVVSWEEDEPGLEETPDAAEDDFEEQGLGEDPGDDPAGMDPVADELQPLEETAPGLEELPEEELDELDDLLDMDDI